MPRLLRIDASIDPERSRSRRITAAFADAWTSRGEDHDVDRLDLLSDPVPHLRDAALHWAPALRREGARPDADEERLQRRLIDRLLAADVLLVGAPMYNWSIPSALKAWIDHVHVPGVTAPFDGSPQPLAGRPAVIVTSRGAVYDPGTPEAATDHVVPALRLVLADALGMRVSVIATSRTLADSVAALAGEAGRAEEELAAAEAEARRLAEEIGAEAA